VEKRAFLLSTSNFQFKTMKAYYKIGQIEAGCDEAGRGCLAGPVVAAAVILPEGFYHKLLNDSKKVSEKNRFVLRDVVENQAVTWAVAMVDNQEIDETNILRASITAMHRALDKLAKVPDFILIDGNRFVPYRKIPHQCIIKGDSKYASIAAASILAKTHRDEYMQKLHTEHPEYQWNRNKAYPTKAHREAIKKYGITKYHRQTFRLLKPVLPALEF